MKEDPPSDARCRDKFLVQTVALAPDHDASNISGIWANIENVNKSSIQERKIRVVFLPADGGNSTPSHQSTHGQPLGDEAPPAYGSPTPSFGSPGPSTVNPVNRAATDGQGKTGFMGSKSNSSNIQSSVANTVPASSDELHAQLADAKAEISRLTQHGEEQNIRQRKSDAVNQDARERITTGTTGMGIQQQPAEGVPVQIVAALCLLSFLLAYFFF
ncbi:MAG: hypothetical protein LQ344_006159 [Seirophora lacunosa]|nr:MAG: hypothetical protein LQ344_006159 [Seirophora lacunosa]